MEAIYRAAKSGVPIKFETVTKLDAFRGPPATKQL